MTRTVRRKSVGWLLAATLVCGLIWWAILPAWSAPDEPGHYLYARLLADVGHTPRPGDISPETETSLLASLRAQGWWEYNNRPMPSNLARLSDDPVLAASGSQIGDEPPAYYLVPALTLRLLDPNARLDPAVALRWLRLWSLALRLAAVLCAWLLARRLWSDREGRAGTVTLLVGLLPMVGFIGGSLNNDALAMFWGALTFALLALARSSRQWLLAITVAFSGPLFVDHGLLFYVIAALIWAFVAWPVMRPYRRYAAIVFILIALLTLAPNPRWAAGWRRTPEIPTSRAGNALALAQTPGQVTILTQTLAGKIMPELRGQEVKLQADVLESDGVVQIGLDDGSHTETSTCTTGQTCALVFVLAPDAAHLQTRIEAAAPTRVRVRLIGSDGRDLLFNGDGRQPDLLSSPIFLRLERALPVPAGYFAQGLSPSSWDSPALFRYALFAAFSAASFWGYFGWLTRPFPWPVYLLLAGVTLLAAWGVLRRALAGVHHRRQGDDSRIVALASLTLALALSQIWLPMIGQSWQPQGRYLFPSLVPIAILLALGWEAILPQRWRPRLPLMVGFGLAALNMIAWWVVVR